MSAKILIGADELRSIIERNPEVEVDLLRSAVPQIAEIIRRKAAEKEPAIRSLIDEAFNRLTKEVGRNYGISESARTVIRFYLGEMWEKEFKALAASAAESFAKEAAASAVGKAVKEVRRQITVEEDAAQQRLAEWAKAAAEREVVALLRAGKFALTPEA